MATDEEYLDNLLKSLTENEQQMKSMEETLNEMTRTSAIGGSHFGTTDDLADMQDFTEENESDDEGNVIAAEAPVETGMNDDILADFFAEALSEENNASVAEDSQANEDALTDFFSEALEEEENVLTEPEEAASKDSTSLNEAEDWQSGLDDLLAKADEQVNTDSNSVNTDNMDVTELIDHMENADEDLAEINGLLKSEDNNRADNDDMLALLEGIKENSADDSDRNEETFDIFAENTSEENFDAIENENEANEEKPSKKRKKDKKEKKDKVKQRSLKKDEDGLNSGDSLDIPLEDKKPGIFSKMLDFLTREEDEFTGTNGENDEILDKINKENEKKAKKEEKKKKKAEKKKGKSDAEAEEDDLEAGADTGKKKKKKEKKEKKKKEKETNAPEEEKPVKVLSRKNLLVLIAACATLLASICALSTFLTEYSDKQNARQAFYDGDYEEVYRLLYEKNLNSGDSVIYNRAKTVLTIERKLDSYKNNLTMNRELEALDALMQGIRCYQELKGVDEYGVREEVDAIYQQICSILADNYDITIEKALEINACDNEAYTRILNSIINGTGLQMPGEEAEPEAEELPPQDILMEEEEIISY